MRTALCALALLIGPTGAYAEVWQAREGTCREWRSRWNVEQQQDGVWVGTTDHVLVGGPCQQGGGSRSMSSVRAVIVGENFFAARRQDNGSVCSYYGQIERDRVRGFELCEGNPTRLLFALRFPPGESREVRERYQGRDADEWLDDPRTLEPGQPPQGFSPDFQLGPRRR
jgi:hypothetical protein